jgi:pilus assembly protein CpaE
VKSAPIRVLVAVNGDAGSKLVDTALSDPGIEVVGVIETSGELTLREGLDAEALVIASNGDSEGVIAYLNEAARDRPDLPVVVASGGTANGLVRRVFELGADDIVMLEDSPAPGADTFFALQKAVARRSGGGSGERSGGSLITVLGPKGGTGKTLTSANLACALALDGKRTVVVDLDLQFGDLGLALGLEPERTSFDLATSGGGLDPDKVDAYLVEHACGLRALIAPVRPDQASGVTAEFLRSLYPILTASYDYVIVDTPPGFTPEVITTIDSSSSIAMVGMLDAPSLKNTKLGLETLELMQYPRERVRVVLNRADANVGITHADVLSLLGRPPDALVPSQRDIVRSVNRGEPIVLSAKRSEPAKVFRALAQLYENDHVAAPAVPRQGRRRLIGGKS